MESGDFVEGKINIAMLSNITFSDIKAIDWYDGPTWAFCISDELDRWFFASPVYITYQPRRRIFLLIELDESQTATMIEICSKTVAEHNNSLELLRKTLADLVRSHKGAVWLFDTEDIDKERKTIIEVDKSYLRYFESLDAVDDQTEEDVKKWLDVFK